MKDQLLSYPNYSIRVERWQSASHGYKVNQYIRNGRVTYVICPYIPGTYHGSMDRNGEIVHYNWTTGSIASCVSTIHYHERFSHVFWKKKTEYVGIIRKKGKIVWYYYHNDLETLKSISTEKAEKLNGGYRIYKQSWDQVFPKGILGCTIEPWFYQGEVVYEYENRF